ncbi:MAG: hypothetical protein AAFZ65_08795 [Planctomycetota bacterium]
MSSASRIPIGPRLCVVLLAACVLSLEFGLREWGGFGRRVVSDVDGRYGIVLLPDQKVVSRNGRVPIRINSEGFRGQDWGPREPDPSLLRVAVLGDSMAYGSDVAEAETWPRRLEASLSAWLQARGDPRRAQVLNGSRPGSASPQKLLVYEDALRARAPDVIVYALAPHDVQRLPRLESDAVRSPWRDFLLRTAIYDFAVRQVVRGGVLRIDANGNEVEWSRHNKAVLAQPFADEHRTDWDALGSRLDTLRRELEGRGALLLIVPNPILQPQREPHVAQLSKRVDAWAEPLARCRVETHRPFQADLFKATTAFHAAGLSLDAIWSDGSRRELSDAAAALVDGSRVDYPYLPKDMGHLSSAGHARLATVVFDALLERLDG